MSRADCCHSFSPSLGSLSRATCCVRMYVKVSARGRMVSEGELDKVCHAVDMGVGMSHHVPTARTQYCSGRQSMKYLPLTSFTSGATARKTCVAAPCYCRWLWGGHDMRGTSASTYPKPHGRPSLPIHPVRALLACGTVLPTTLVKRM